MLIAAFRQIASVLLSVDAVAIVAVDRIMGFRILRFDRGGRRDLDPGSKTTSRLGRCKMGYPSIRKS
jgi:hypothetical protein